MTHYSQFKCEVSNFKRKKDGDLELLASSLPYFMSFPFVVGFRSLLLSGVPLLALLMNSLKKLTPINVFLFLSLAVAAVYADSNDESSIAAVLAANEARSIALVAHDLQALDQILAPDFNYTHSGNQQETKATHIGSLESGLRYTKYETSELRANVITPDVITLNGFFDQIKGRGGNMREGKYLFLSVWRRAGDSWQMTSLQSALPPTAK